MLTFGPVPSRRLGRSLGINNIPPKTCSFSCLYCQVGRTDAMQISRQAFYAPKTIVEDVIKRINRVSELGESIDFLTFVPDGEPTLDNNLGEAIDLLRPLGIKIAVISNASLLWQKSVRDDLYKADWVSLKIDAVSQGIWQRINRPHRDLNLPLILESMLQFSENYGGTLVTETMLLSGVNDSQSAVREIAVFLEKLKPEKSYLAIPTRPPVETDAHPPDENVLNMAYHLVREKVRDVECLFGYEGNAFTVTGNVEEDLLHIVAVHPMREEAVRDFLAKAGAEWSLIDKLIAQDLLCKADYAGKIYYVRRTHKRHD